MDAIFHPPLSKKDVGTVPDLRTERSGVVESGLSPHPLDCTLVDILDRVLDKGIVIRADIIISLAGIPLVGVNLGAAIAGMETMVNYGIMGEWDREIRGQGAVGSGQKSEVQNQIRGKEQGAICQE